MDTGKSTKDIIGKGKVMVNGAVCPKNDVINLKGCINTFKYYTYKEFMRTPHMYTRSKEIIKILTSPNTTYASIW